MRFYYCLFFFFFFNQIVFAQNIPQNPNKTDKKGLRQGKWTVWLDVFDKPTQDISQVYQYLILNYQEDKPIGKTQLFNLENHLIGELNLISDRPTLQIDGWAQYYYFNTNAQRSLKQHRVLYDKGKKVRKEYFTSGFETVVYDENYQQQIKAKLAKIPPSPNKTDAQGKRQGKWTVWLGQRDTDVQTRLTDDPEFVNYYLLLEYLNDKPIGTVKRYDLENKLESEFTLWTDHPNFVYDGLLTYFYSNGTKTTYLYDKGEIVEQTSYYSDGTVNEVTKHDWKYTHQEAITQDMDANHSTAFNLFVSAKKKADKAQVPRDFEYGILCNNLAYAYKRQGENHQALTLFLEAKDIFKKDINSYEYATVCTNIAEFYELQGNYQASLSHLIESARTPESREAVGHRMSLARLYFKMGKQASTDSLVKLVEQYYENDLQTTEDLSANYASDFLFWYESLDLASKSAIFREKIVHKIAQKFGKNTLDYGIALNNLGSDYQEQGDFNRALGYYQQAAKIKENLSEIDSLSLADTYTNIGVCFRKLNQIESAIQYLEKAKLIYLRKCDTEYAKTANPADIFINICRYLATNYHNLGFAYLFKPDYKQAKYFLQEAAGIRRHLNGEQSYTYAITCEALAYYHQLQNRLDSSLHCLQIANEIYASIEGNKSISYAQSKDRIGDLYFAQKQYAPAYKEYNQGSKVFLNSIQQNFANLSEKEQKLYYQLFNPTFEKYVAFMSEAYNTLPETIGWIYDNVLITKGLLFQSSEKVRRSILNSKDKTLLEKYRNWKLKKDFLAKIVQMQESEKQKTGIDEKQLTNEVNQIEKDLAQKSQAFASLVDKTQVKWQDIQKQLKTNELTIEIVRFRTFNLDFTQTIKYVALIVSSTAKQPELVILENGIELENKFIKYYRNSIQYKKADKYSYEQFWAKIQQKIMQLAPSPSERAGVRLYLSVDGVYNMLNINTLQNPETKQYVSEMYDIQMLSNTRDLITYSKNPKTIQQNFKNYQIHLFGYPEYSGGVLKPETDREEKRSIFQKVGGGFDTTQRFLSGEGKISVLEGTKVEVENISQLFKNQAITPRVYLSKSASEDALKKLQNPDILHIATHGYFLANLPDIEEGERSFGGIETQVLGENPLLRCGLLLANAEEGIKIGEIEGQENGVLTAQEAMNLNLDNTDLVVMSACETGLGEIKNGEGVYGLQRAFQQAGAKTVLMSLWTVSDEATQELMTLFYQNLITKKQPKRLAFQNAQNELKKKFPEPYYWGAFVMVGE